MSPHRHPHPPTSEQDTIVHALLQPKTYPHRPDRVTHLQTHISHIFLTGPLVYKIKKPVRYDFLDFSTLERRGYFCRQEVKLNRRLTRDLYLRVDRITEENGKVRLNGRGRVVEYAVVMREMPQERMMNRLLAAGDIGGEEIKGLVRILVPFYQNAQTGGAVNHDGTLPVIRRNAEENFLAIRPLVGRLFRAADYKTVLRYTRHFMERTRRLFERRVAEGRIRDCHGDLHSANICLEPGEIQIYDCIEFNHRFRYADVVCDLAFLAMDLDFHGYAVLSRFLLREYVRRTGDRESGRLMPFYKCYRACVRAKVHALAAAEAEVPAGERGKHRALAKRYFHLALSYARADRPLKVMVFFGLMGTGKTTLALALHRETGWKVISSDVVRKRLVGLEPTTRRTEAFGRGIYAPGLSLKTYEAMRAGAEQALQQGHSVILDGSYKRRDEREAVLELARDLGAEVCFVECTAPLSIIRDRLEKRGQDPRAVSDGRWEIFRAQKADFDLTRGWIKKHGLRVRVDQSPELLIRKILARINSIAS